jgi:hypothetical protein
MTSQFLSYFPIPMLLFLSCVLNRALIVFVAIQFPRQLWLGQGSPGGWRLRRSAAATVEEVASRAEVPMHADAGSMLVVI